MARTPRASPWTTVLTITAGGAALFVVLGGLGVGYAPRDVAFLGVLGALLGAIAAPELEPKAFRHPTRWQVGFGALGGVLCALAFHAPVAGFLAGALAGGVVGALAPHWLKHVQIP